MTADLLADVLAGICLISGALLSLAAGVGLLRFPDLLSRMHAATKAPTLALAQIGIAATIALGEGRPKALLAVTFIFITAPSAAHLLGRAAYRAEGIEIDLEARDDLAALIDAPDEAQR